MANETTKSQETTTAKPLPPRVVPQHKMVAVAQDVSRVTPEQRRLTICEAAYYIAKRRGFELGHDVDDWLTAERRIDALFTGLALRGRDIHA
jgi:Protein of unknown function (DUF2934)